MHQISINGILLLDKPLQISSNKALQRVKHIFHAKKAGHTGSLDPLASGMLPICFGEATKFSQFLLDADKHYFVQAQLGVKTSTGDAEGEIIANAAITHITLKLLNDALLHFKGEMQQIPPMYSALKQAGKPLYVLARQGIEVKREPRLIQIYDLTFISFEKDIFTFSVHCSKGTYIRTLVEDIGEFLNCGAHVKTLRRTAIASFSENNMITLDMLETMTEPDGLQNFLLPIDSGIQSLPAIILSSHDTVYLCTGRVVTLPEALPTKTLVRLYNDKNVFLGVGEFQENNTLIAKRLVATQALFG